ncbi:MAG: hypothetical protein AAGE84_15480 [Cyanobacteria bacterium P01_G01_bin.39]
MTKKVLFENILDNHEFPIFRAGIERLEQGNRYYHQLNLIDNHEVESHLDHLLHQDEEELINSVPMTLADTDALITDENADFISSLAFASAQSDATAIAEKVNTDSESTADADADANTIGLDNAGKISTKEDEDILMGIALSRADAEADADSSARLNSNSVATADAIADAIGISNSGKIYTGEDNDAVIGIANVFASSDADTNARAKSLAGNDLEATATSASTAIVKTSAIGIENFDTIHTGLGSDMIVGVANNWATSVADAEAFARNTAALATEYATSTLDQVETAIATSTAASTAISQSLTIGLANAGLIRTGRGHEVILGLAFNNSSSEALVDADAEATAKDFATAFAAGESQAVSESITIGIINSGRIATGRGGDTVIGIAVDDVTAFADADVDANAVGDVPDAQTTSNAVSDTEQGFSIGIDNTSGVIATDIGDDQVIGYGETGIKGGQILTGKNHDQVIAYGIKAGLQAARVRLGAGNDYFRAALVDFDPFTGHIEYAEDQSGAIQDAVVSGGNGNDTFDIGGFASDVVIDGGRDYDVFKLWGSIDEYEITLGSSDHQEIAIKGEDAMLTVKNVEALYFGDSGDVYNYHDFA